MNQKEEEALRESIRHMIKHVKQKRTDEEYQLREVIRSFIDIELKSLKEAQTPDNSPTPNKSTGINVLEDLLKKIIPVLETDYKLLTTSSEQRKSFRSHVIQAVVGTLTPAITNNEADDEIDQLQEFDEFIDMDEEIEIDVGDEGGEDGKFIDIRTDAEKSADDEQETGRNMAYQSFKKIETSVIDSYELLSNEEDQELFYDYLIANLKLYFDKFETELADQVDEPTNQAYDMAKSDPGPDAQEDAPELEL